MWFRYTAVKTRLEKLSRKPQNMCQNCLSLEFRNVFKRHLGRTLHKHWKKLAVDILSVSVGVKPSFLVDYGEARSAEQWCSVLCELSAKDLIAVQLDVLVENGTDILIIQKHLLSRLGQLLREMPPEIVDVSGAGLLATPKVLTPRGRDHVVKEIVTELAERYDGSSSTTGKGTEIISLCFSERINRTTLYGILLGYPIVYWYHLTDGAKSENCLHMHPLCVNKLSLSLACIQKRELTKPTACTSSSAAAPSMNVIYSFSYPQEMEVSMQNSVSCWLAQMENRVSQQNIFAGSHLFKDCITLSAVAL